MAICIKDTTVTLSTLLQEMHPSYVFYAGKKQQAFEYMCMYLYVSVCIRICICMYLYVSEYVNICACICMYLYVSEYVSVCICMYMYVYVCSCMYMYVAV